MLMTETEILLIQRQAHRESRFGVYTLCFWALRGDIGAQDSLRRLVRK